MPRRILVAGATRAIVTALRRDLDGTDYAVDAVPHAGAAEQLDVAHHVAAIVRGDDGAAATLAALRAVDPGLPVIALFFDDEEAQRHRGALGADGVLVGPLTAAAVAGTCRMADRMRALGRRVRMLEAALARRGRGDGGLDALKRHLLLEVKRSKRYGHPVSLALVAVDRWPEVSAALGKSGSAALLVDLLAALNASVRDIDLVAPFAEERLVVLMPHTRADGALLVARRLCAKIRAREAALSVTASAGVAGHDGGGTISFGALVKRAAEALTRARAAGGDRAEPADPPPKRDRIVMG